MSRQEEGKERESAERRREPRQKQTGTRPDTGQTDEQRTTPPQEERARRLSHTELKVEEYGGSH